MDQPAENDKTPIIVACQNGNSQQLKHLLDNGASVKVRDSSGKTALHHCADNLETQCAEMLLEKDSSILEVKDEQGYTALGLAVLVGNVNLIKLLLEKGADINTEDNEGHKLSHWAAVCGHLKVLDILIQNKADMSSADNHRAYPVHYAAQMNGDNSGNTESHISERVLKKFIDSKVKLDVVDDAGRQPLLWAACSGNAESCRLLLKAGADINSSDKDELTALHCAASRGHYDCIEVLRKNGADVNRVDKNKCTPLFYAITLGNKDCTVALIKAKADVNHVDDRGRNPAHCAAIKGCMDTVKLLEKEKADLWHQNNKGDYPIHEAAQKGHIDVVKYLIHQKNEADAVNVTNKVGKTLLHIAAATNNLPLCKLLINADCDKNALMKHAGKEFTPYDLAVIKGYKEAADYLKQKGALPYSNLSNVKKRESRSARSRKSANVGFVPEESEPKEKTSQKTESQTKGKKTDRTASSAEDRVGPVAGEATVIKKSEEQIKGEREETEKVKRASPKQQRPKSSESQKLDKSVGIDKSTTAVNTDEEKQQQVSKKPSPDSVLEKEDGIRTSAVSLRSEESPLLRDAGTQKEGPRLRDETTSPMGQSQAKKKDVPADTGKYVSLERIEPKDDSDSSPERKQLSRQTGRKTPRSRVGFNEYDSGMESVYTRSKSKRTHRTHKPYIDHVRDSVRAYQTKRNQSRSLNQLKRAQIHTGPMHDIVMFSKMMDNYRRGLATDEEDVDLRTYANWDGYLNEGSSSGLLPMLVNRSKEFQRKKNVDMDKEIDSLAARTAELFDNVKTGAASSLVSAKSRNTKLQGDMKKTREERLQTTTDPLEKAYLQRQALEDHLEDQQHELEAEKKERYKSWHRRKDEEMRRRLLQAYRPYFPNDVFSKKSVKKAKLKPLRLTPRAKSHDVKSSKANWSRKYDGSIRPRTSLVFVEPRVYDDLLREEKEAKQQISADVRRHLTNGDVHHNQLPNDDDSLLGS